jgi:hypothetical protein
LQRDERNGNRAPSAPLNTEALLARYRDRSANIQASTSMGDKNQSNRNALFGRSNQAQGYKKIDE